MISPWNDPFDTPPSIPEYLEATKKDLRLEYEARVRWHNGVTFDDFWEVQHVGMFGQGEKKDARALAWLFEQRPIPDPAAEKSLALAVVHWLEAEHSYEVRKDGVRSWAALVRCHFYLGMASGPETPGERQSRGGNQRSEPFRQLRKNVLEVLAKLPDDRFVSLREAIDYLAPTIKSFDSLRTLKTRNQVRHSGRQIKLAHGRTQNPTKLLGDWRRKDAEVGAAFERVIKGGIKRGRKPKEQVTEDNRPN